MVLVWPWLLWIIQAGGNPANFLDVGGTADAARVEQAFRIIHKDPEVKALLVNIWWNRRCDRVAQGTWMLIKILETSSSSDCTLTKAQMLRGKSY